MRVHSGFVRCIWTAGVFCILSVLWSWTAVDAEVQATDNVHEAKVVVTWDEAIDPSWSYRILRNDVQGAVGGQVLTVLSHTERAWSDTTGVPGKVYSYVLESVDEAGLPRDTEGKDDGGRIVFAPENLMATDRIHAERVVLTWEDKSTVEMGFYIWRAVNGDSFPANPIAMIDKNKTRYEDFPPAEDVDYSYVIRAIDGKSFQSALSNTSVGARGKLNPPGDVSATDGQHPDKVVVTWTDRESTEDGYEITRITPTGSTVLPDLDPNVESFDDVPPDSGDVYTYSVRAFMNPAVGATRIYSIPQQDEGRWGALAAPMTVAATVNTYDDRVEVTWNDPADTEDGFVVYRAGTEIGRVNRNSESFIDRDAEHGVPYQYSISAYTAFGSESAQASTTTDGIRSIVLPPVSVNATDGEYEDRVVITWVSNATAAVMYNIYRNAQRIHTASADTRRVVDFEIEPGLDHAYKVRSVAADGTESAQEVDDGRRVLAHATNVTATDMVSDDGLEDRVRITWDDNSDVEEGYRIYRQEGTSIPILVGERPSGSVTFDDLTGTPGIPYVYIVRGFDAPENAAGDRLNAREGESPSRPESRDTGSRDLRAPTRVRATDGDFEEKVVVTWEDNSLVEDGFIIYRNGNPIDTIRANRREYEHEFGRFTLFRTEPKDYRVVARQSVKKVKDTVKNMDGIHMHLPNSGQWESTEGGIDAGFTKFLEPGSFVASKRYLNKVVLTWVDRSGIEDRYQIQRKESGTNWDAAERFRSDDDTEFYEDLSAEAGKEYVYRIRAIQTGNNPIQTEWVQANGKALESLAKPGILSISTQYKEQITLTWIDRSNDEWGYRIRRKKREAGFGTYSQIALLGPDSESYVDEDVKPSRRVTAKSGENFASGSGKMEWDLVDEETIEHVVQRAVRRNGNTWIPARKNENPPSNLEWVDHKSLGPRVRQYDVQAKGRYRVRAILPQYYTYRVDAFTGSPKRSSEARNSDGKLGGRKLDPQDVESRFAKVSASDGAFSSQVLVEWEDLHENELGFSVYRGNRLIGSPGADATSFGDFDAVPGEIREYEVKWIRPPRTVDHRSETERELLPHEDAQEVVETSGFGSFFAPLPPTQRKFRYTISWERRSDVETYRVLRDGRVIETVDHRTTSYTEEQTLEERSVPFAGSLLEPDPVYSVEAKLGEVEIPVGSDFGRRKPNGNISGRISSSEGGGVEGVELCLEPLVSRALFFDGAGGFVGMEHFSLPNAFTLAFWVNLSEAKQNVLIANGSATAGDPHFAVLTTADSKLAVEIEGERKLFGDIGTGSWHYVTVVKDQKEVTVYKNKGLAGVRTYSNAGDFKPKDYVWSLGMWRKDGDPKGFLGGRLDELRIWRGTRTLDQIVADRGRVLDETTEEDLIDYWPIEDSPVGAIADLARSGIYGVLTNGVYRTEDVAPFNVCAITDADGNYDIANIRYRDRQKFKVRPLAAGRQFSPTFKNVVLNEENPVENGLSFSDVSSYTASGTVRFAPNDIAPGAICPAPNVHILVDGEVRGTTDKDGHYAVAVDPGEHVIRAQFPDETLPKSDRREFKILRPMTASERNTVGSNGNVQVNGRTYTSADDLVVTSSSRYSINFTESQHGLDFADITTRELTVRVGAGCELPIGTALIQLRDESGSIATTIEADSDIVLTLPSLKYFLSVSKVDPVSPEFPPNLVASLVQFFDNLGWQEADFSSIGTSEGSPEAQDVGNLELENRREAELEESIQQNITLTTDFIYRAPLRVRISISPADDRCVEALDALVVKQSDPVLVSISVEEYYGEGKFCEADTGKVTLFDEMSDNESTPVVVPVSRGEAVYSTVVGGPNVTTGRVDASGKTRDYQKAISVTAEVLGQRPVQQTQWVVVVGQRPRAGTFTSYQFDEMPIFVLRDPPGDGSSSSLDRSQSVEMKLGASFGTGIGLGGFEHKTFADNKLIFGTVTGAPGNGAIVLKELDFKSNWSIKPPEIKYGYTDTDELAIGLSFSEKVSTSSSGDLIGEDADVYIGFAPNLVFAKTDVISINSQCVAVRTESVLADLNVAEDQRFYAYTGHHIRNTVIPQLEELLVADVTDKLGSLPTQEEVERIGRSVANWRLHLDKNREFKRKAGKANPKSIEEFEGVLVIENDSLVVSDGSDFGDRNDDDAVGLVLRTPGRNRAFSAGATVEYSETFKTGDSCSWSNTGEIASGADFEIGVKAGGGGSITKFSIGVAFNFTVSGGDAREDGHTVSYTLSDDDLGDFFSVDVEMDTRFGTPVFKNVIGTTSAPWEPWFKDSSFEGDALTAPSNLGTQRRNSVGLKVAPPERQQVPADQPATFTLTMSNASESDEARSYILSAVNESNPHGAILKVNGRPLGDVVFGMNAFESQEITLTVEKGPEYGVYERLGVIAHAPGEDPGMPGMSETVYLDVEFLPPSSPITFLEPRKGWVFGASTSSSDVDTIRISLVDFDLAVSKGDSLDRIVAQYRPVNASVEEDRLEGVERVIDWREIDRAGRDDIKAVPGNDTPVPIPGSGTMTFFWDVTDLPDGEYEMRAYTEYKTDADSPTTLTNYSETMRGTIDRSSPQVFGTPEPADGILSLGESVAITFGEPIQCGTPDELASRLSVSYPSLDSNGEWEVDGDGLFIPGAPVQVSAVCDGRTIVLAMDPGLDLEGDELLAEVAGITDVVGNPLPEPVQWVFGVRRSAFTWRQTSLTASVDAGQSGSFEAEIVNGTSSVVEFDLTTPEWLTPSVARVNLPQGESQTVRFHSRPQSEDGVYTGIVRASSAGEETELAVNLVVLPDWQMDPSSYQHSMNLIARIEIPAGGDDGGTEPSENVNDQIAAFVGSELRGVGSVQDVGGEFFAFLTIYSNTESGDRVRLKVWDDTAGIPYDSDVVDLDFVANTIVGSPIDPEIVSAVEDPSTLPLVQEIPIQAGWNWFASQVDLSGVALDDAFESLEAASGDQVKSLTSTSIFSGSWPATVSIEPGKSYAIWKSAADTLVFQGSRIAFDTPIDLVDGWNWIGFTGTTPVPIDAALANLDAQNGDWILSRTAFAQFSGDRWWGSLGELGPEEGYRLFMFQKRQDRLEFSDGASKPAVAVTKPLLAGNARAWFVDPNRHPNRMAVVANLDIEGASTIDPTDMVGAFVGDELRGVTQPTLIPGQKTPVAFLMVHGAGEEQIQFRVFDADRDEILHVSEGVAFKVDQALGSVAEPMVLNARILRTPDFDADGKIGFSDFLMFAGVFGTEQAEEAFEGRFDLNDDGAVNFPDFLMFTTAFVSPAAAKPSLTGSVLPPVEVGANAEAQLALKLESGTREDEVNVMVQVLNAEAVTGYGFTLAHDPALLEFVSAANVGESRFGETGAPALNIETSPGEVRLADMLDGQVPEAGDLVQLTFRSIGTTAGASVDLADAMIADGLGGLNELLGAHLGSVRAIPSEFGLARNRPNPFNPVTEIGYQLAEEGAVRLHIYNVLGQEVRKLVQEDQVAGYYRVTWDGRDNSGRGLSTGVYIYRITAGNFVATEKMLLLK